MDIILLILTSTQQYRKGFARALELSRGKKLHVLFILDPKGAKGMSSSLRDMSFIGLKSTGQLTNMVSDEYRLRAIRMLEELEQHAGDLRVECSTRLAMGDFTQEAVRAVENKKPTSIVVNRNVESFLSRYIFKGRFDELKNAVSCPVEVVDEDLRPSK